MTTIDATRYAFEDDKEMARIVLVGEGEMLSNWFKWLIRRLLIKNTTQNEILEIEIREHQGFEKVSTMKEAYNYYRNRTAIRNKKVDVDHGRTHD